MGRIWRSIMPLLPTLAALVIIVNSAEEDLESEYRHDLRPRTLDTGTPNYDQVWRAMEADPPLEKLRSSDNWNADLSDNLPKRRRSGRKRKRRPLPVEELAPQERFAYHEEPSRPFIDVDLESSRHTTVTPKRRRKIPESRPIRWTDDVVDIERPTRRRGQRRKRPSLNNWPVLAEFRHAVALNNRPEDKTESIDQVENDDFREESPREDYVQVHETKHELEQSTSNLKLDPYQGATDIEFPLALDDGDEINEPQKVSLVGDKDLSEFSAEAIIAARRPTIETKHENKSEAVFEEFDKSQDKCLSHDCRTKGIGNFLSFLKHDIVDIDPRYVPVVYTKEQGKAFDKVTDIIAIDAYKLRELNKKTTQLMFTKCKDKLREFKQINSQGLRPVTWMENNDLDRQVMDPVTLKDILKRSNGTSLSEILQKHNLSLTDLLRGKDRAVSLFKPHDSLEISNKNQEEPKNELPVKQSDLQNAHSQELSLIKSETKYTAEPNTEYSTVAEIQTQANKKDEEDETTTPKPLQEITPKSSIQHRFSTGIRKKLRMRPMLNNTYKGQLSRDLIALNARKYSQHRRNVTKSKESKDSIPSMLQNNTQTKNNDTTVHETTTIAIKPDDSTTTIAVINNNTSSEDIKIEYYPNSKLEDVDMDITEATDVPKKETLTEIPKTTTEKPKVVSMIKPSVNSTGLRRQAFNNRLKKKRLKDKNATTEPPQDDLLKHLFGIGGLVSSSEFIARTQEPMTVEDDSKDLTTLDDFMMTESTHRSETEQTRTTKVPTTPTLIPSTTEETAKIEIEEILNDTRTSAKLSKILMERNMTLSELVEHRERGSSHVHLADIFHNASREPNPPEPFLSKSLLEPISKETYPLRALLDANLHDPSTRATTIDPNIISHVNIPVVMDFGNNVNENAENMGIMSLFNNFTQTANKKTQLEDFDLKEQKLIETVDNTNTSTVSDTVRESRVINNNKEDVVSWSEILSLMRKNQNGDSSFNSPEGPHQAMKPFKNIRLDEDLDGDGLIVLEDLRHFKDFDNNADSGSEEKFELNPYVNQEPHHGSGILDKIPSQTKSVTVATASIAGLAMILFLLTYAAFKWKQQRSVIRKKRSFGDERIPTPVFENRKGHKHNSSTRSISPMLQTSNIYTLNTLDSQNGKESPDYMWDTLRKPFQ